MNFNGDPGHGCRPPQDEGSRRTKKEKKGDEGQTQHEEEDAFDMTEWTFAPADQSKNTPSLSPPASASS